MQFTTKLLTLLIAGTLAFGTAAAAREQVNLKLQDIKIEELIKMVGKANGKNILLDKPIPGTVNFVSSTPIYKDELFTILLSVLNSKGFTMVQEGSYLKIVRQNVAVKENLPINARSGSALMQTRFISAKNENIDVIAAKVRQFLSPAGKLLTIKENNMMIVSDTPGNIGVIETIVKKIDRDQAKDVRAEFIPLSSAKASRLAASITKIAKAIINQKVENNKVEILSDDATNAIIILATQENIDKLTPLISRLDEKDDSTNQRLTIIPLENSEAKNVVASLQAVLDKKKYAKEADKPTVSVYDELNALVVSGLESDINDIRAMIKVLDVEKPQVFVKARIIEINQNMADSIGVKYGLAGGAVTDAGLFTFAADLGGAAIAFDGGGLINLSSATFDSGIAFGATIDFLASNGAANTLSQPTLLCVNNQESSIYVGRTEPIVTSTAQAADTTSVARNTYTREDIGLTLKIKPRLSQGNKVTLITTAKLEDILNSSVAGLPSTTKREVVTTAIVGNGESVIIGGLIYDKNRDEAQGIPYLRDIPLIGGLFDWRYSTHEKINLVIVLTPFIVRNSDEMTKIRKLLQELDGIQDEYEKLIEQKLEERKEELDKDASDSNTNDASQTSASDSALSVITPAKR
ncbi:type II secretion system secretin GspD [Sulfurimonas diazotrophicus]|uniref:Type II secretion system secretin GspD n=1 Tax=Sulfurimonas diazotrophicus TaxID=3131939 RepID=A0ABZ3H8Y1_9BACT